MEVITKIIALLLIFLIATLPLIVMWWLTKRVFSWANSLQNKNLQIVKKKEIIDYYEIIILWIFLFIAILTSSYAHFIWQWPVGSFGFEEHFIAIATQCRMEINAIEQVNILRNSTLVASLGMVFMSFRLRYRIHEQYKNMVATNQQEFSLYPPILYSLLLGLVTLGISLNFDTENMCNGSYNRVGEAIFLSILVSGASLLFLLFLIWGGAFYMNYFKESQNSSGDEI